LFSRDAEEQGQIDACRDRGLAMMVYAVLGRGMLSAEIPKVEEMPGNDVRRQLPRLERANLEKNLRLRSALEAIARGKNATLAQLAIAWPMARGARAGAFILPIPGAKSRKHLEENVHAADIVLTADELAEIDHIVPPGTASGTRYPSGQMHRVNV
jgi:aryl-alcohol dehydrogenase-like predicted oxidoreductase